MIVHLEKSPKKLQDAGFDCKTDIFRTLTGNKLIAVKMTVTLLTFYLQHLKAIKTLLPIFVFVCLLRTTE